MMASQQSSITSISIAKNPEPMTPPRHTTSTGKRTSNANPTVSTPAPVLTDAVQKCVDTAAEAIATHREAKLVFMQGLLRRILREAYREPTNPPSTGTPLAQSVFTGMPSPSRGPSLCFVAHPNYQNGQFQHYNPPEYPIPISQSATTSAHTASTIVGVPIPDHPPKFIHQCLIKNLKHHESCSNFVYFFSTTKTLKYI